MTWTSAGAPPTGPHTVIIEHDPGLSSHTVYRPHLSAVESLPIVSWGNGACSADGLAFAEFLAELTSHGYVIIANGPPVGTGFSSASDPQDGSTHIAALDWAIAENSDPCSPYFNKLDTSKIAIMGQSCGGLMTLNAAGDPRITTAVAWNSGLLNEDPNVYASLHAPLAYFNGGPSDVAHANGNRDYQQIDSVPVYKADLPVGHSGTYEEDNGGEFAPVGLAWLDWHLKGDESATGKGMFLGEGCGICNSDWVIEHKNFE